MNRARSGQPWVVPARGMRRVYAPAAFSLVEMLVSVAIIVLLISIMLPALKRSIRQASATVCMHNLRAIDQVVQMYRMENGGWLPFGVLAQFNSAGTGTLPWYDVLVPRYLRDASVLICPEDPFHTTLELASRMPVHPDWLNASSYGMNEFILSSPEAFLANVEHNPPPRPMDTLLIADMGPDFGGMGKLVPTRNRGKLNWSDGFDYRVAQVGDSWLTRRHTASINTLTIGGAVRTVRTAEMFDKVVQDYYEPCAAGDCTFCVELGLPHYSFAHAQTYWWTGARPSKN